MLSLFCPFHACPGLWLPPAEKTSLSSQPRAPGSLTLIHTWLWARQWFDFHPDPTTGDLCLTSEIPHFPPSFLPACLLSCHPSCLPSLSISQETILHFLHRNSYFKLPSIATYLLLLEFICIHYSKRIIPKPQVWDVYMKYCKTAALSSFKLFRQFSTWFTHASHLGRLRSITSSRPRPWRLKQTGVRLG